MEKSFWTAHLATQHFFPFKPFRLNLRFKLLVFSKLCCCFVA